MIGWKWQATWGAQLQLKGSSDSSGSFRWISTPIHLSDAKLHEEQSIGRQNLGQGRRKKVSVATKSEVATTGKRTAFHYVGPNALIISSQSCTISIQPCRKDCVQCSTVFFTRNIASLSPAPSELCACIHLCASIHHLNLDNPPLLSVQPPLHNQNPRNWCSLYLLPGRAV